jgi:hypothetical protein
MTQPSVGAAVSGSTSASATAAQVQAECMPLLAALRAGNLDAAKVRTM